MNEIKKAEKGSESGETPSPVTGEEGVPKTPEDAQESAGGDGEESFSREYVEGLRREAAEARVKAKKADEAMTRLRDLAVAQAVQGILTNPDDLTWSEELTDEHGWPDHDKIIAAAEAQVSRNPYMGRPRGDVGMGQHSTESDDVSLVRVLAAGA